MICWARDATSTRASSQRLEKFASSSVSAPRPCVDTTSGAAPPPRIDMASPPAVALAAAAEAAAVADVVDAAVVLLMVAVVVVVPERSMIALRKSRKLVGVWHSVRSNCTCSRSSASANRRVADETGTVVRSCGIPSEKKTTCSVDKRNVAALSL